MNHNKKEKINRIEEGINNTIDNMERAEKMMDTTSDANMIRALKEKNKRREEAIENMKEEISEELK